MEVLYQFVLRLAFGLAVAMAVCPPRQITSGFFRNHLYVTLGLSVLATLVALRQSDSLHYGLPLVTAILSYVGSVVWLYEKPRAGRVLLVLVAFAAALSFWQQGVFREGMSPLDFYLWWIDPVTGGMVLGSAMAAMFLGHWYLNTPTMQLDPLQRLVVMMTVAVLLRAAVCGYGLAHDLSGGSMQSSQAWFLALRWLSGIAAPLVLAWMTWKTLEIPNTQSATGILYVAVITTFTGELTAQLLSAHSALPL